MTRFKVEVDRRTGKVLLWMECSCGCGFVPVLGWDDLDGMEEFAHMLLDLCHKIRSERNRERIREISDRLLRQALDPDEPI